MKTKDRQLIPLKSEKSKGIAAFAIISLLSFLIMTITFVFSDISWSLDAPMFKSYFGDGLLLLMNFLPVFIVFVLVYVLSNRIWLGFLLTSVLWITMSIVNRFKLIYRYEPFSFSDLTLFKESMKMADKYEITLNTNMKLMVAGLIVITIALFFLGDYRIKKMKMRAIFLAAILFTSYMLSSTVYRNESVYADTGDKSIINIWSQTQQFQSRGFVYPFLYSITSSFQTPSENYEKDAAEKDLLAYEYSDIPQDRKVNVVAIMLESYNDFSKFDGINWTQDPYEYFHKLQAESYSGTLVTDVFGGGTVNTERSFLTGISDHPDYVEATNSFAWYFKEQGYDTEFMHPFYGWFYDRNTINPNLGFDNFDYYENKYSSVSEGFLSDYNFFDFIIDGSEKSASVDVPYFIFSTTYQNHGPYPGTYSGQPFIEFKDGYEDFYYNIINNYLFGVNKTDNALEKLIEYYRQSDEPTVVVLFGDHNPWLGNDDVGYKMLGIDIDLSTPQGVLNYYETPYIVWGNPAAEESIGKEFTGYGPTISPNFLMVETFEYIGWGGPEYAHYLSDVKSDIDVINKFYYKEDGEYTNELSPKGQQVIDHFEDIEYYYSHNKIER